jgi:ATP-dependent protease ClpP protease subunit
MNKILALTCVLFSLSVGAKPMIAFRTEVNAETVAQFSDALAALDKMPGANIVEINTPGGSVFAGFEMARAIETTLHPVVCIVDGMAASMGLYILQSCDIRLMTERSLLMGHEPMTSARGNRTGILKEVEFLSKLNFVMATHIVRRMNISVDKYLSLIANDTELWLTADEALAIKAVDYKVPSVAAVLKVFQED